MMTGELLSPLLVAVKINSCHVAPRPRESLSTSSGDRTLHLSIVIYSVPSLCLQPTDLQLARLLCIVRSEVTFFSTRKCKFSERVFARYGHGTRQLNFRPGRFKTPRTACNSIEERGEKILAAHRRAAPLWAQADTG